MSARVPNPAPDERTPEQQQLFTVFTSGERAKPGTDFSLVDAEGRLSGPPAAWMWHPSLGLALGQVGAQLRFHLSLTPRQREAVILTIARVEQSPYERYAHEKAGRAAGLTDDEILAIVERGDWAPDAADERAVLELTHLLLTGDDIPSDAFDAATAVIGGQGVFEVVTLIGWYRLMALQLRAFELLPTG